MMPFYFLIDLIALRGTISLPVLQMQILRPMVDKCFALFHRARRVKLGFKYRPPASKSITCLNYGFVKFHKCSLRVYTVQKSGKGWR